MATEAEKVSKSWRNIVSKSWRKLVEDLTTERNQFRDELSALQKRISDAPKVDAFIDIEGNMAFAKPIIGENLRLRRGDVFQVAFLKLEAPEASEKEHPCPAKSR